LSDDPPDEEDYQLGAAGWRPKDLPYLPLTNYVFGFDVSLSGDGLSFDPSVARLELGNAQPRRMRLLDEHD
jgi:hypothetical protein